MASFTPAWPNASRRVALIVALLGLVPAARAEFAVTDVQPRFVGGAVMLNGALELGLTPKVEEALAKGIELPLIIEIRLYRKRSLLWDQRLATWTLRRGLQYHALSGQYLVNVGSDADSFLSSTEALRYLRALKELRLPLSDETIAADHEYFITLRVNLDIESLPAPLRPVAYTTPSWHLNSGWTTWNVKPSAP